MNPESGTAKKPDPYGINFLQKDRPKDARTEITATKQATFDNAANIAEFEGRVVVKDPQFTLRCERLRVTLNKDRKGLQLVEAFGDVVIFQENKDATGNVTKAIGRAQTAVYEPSSGNVVLKIWPSVQQGINNQVATEESTVMTLNRDGKSRTVGSSKTVIVETAESSSL